MKDAVDACPVPPDAWPDSREFLAPEMEVTDWLAHIRDVDRPSVAIDVPGYFRCCAWTIELFVGRSLREFQFLL